MYKKLLVQKIRLKHLTSNSLVSGVYSTELYKKKMTTTKKQQKGVGILSKTFLGLGNDEM